MESEDEKADTPMEMESAVEAEAVIDTAQEVIETEELITAEEVVEVEEVDEGEQVPADVTTVYSGTSLFDAREVDTADLVMVCASARLLDHCTNSHSQGVNAYSMASEASRNLQGDSQDEEFAEAAPMSSDPVIQCSEEQFLDMQSLGRNAHLFSSSALSPRELSMLCEIPSAVQILIRSGSCCGMSDQPGTSSANLRRISSYPTLQSYLRCQVRDFDTSDVHPFTQAMLTNTPSCTATATAAIGTHDTWAEMDRGETSPSAAAGLYALSDDQAVARGTFQASWGGVVLSKLKFCVESSLNYSCQVTC